jgi:4-hydroxybenzoate polyprenyltransferase
MNRVKAYAQLLRIPNVFTAVADVALGWLAALTVRGVAAELPTWTGLVVLAAASACLYSAGMVLNDYFDVEEDRRERPYRPIPSGRVSDRTAGLLGCGLLVAGVALAALAPGGMAGVTAALIAVGVLVYDGWLKRTPLAPVGMAWCRFWNVILGTGMIVLPGWVLLLAGVVATYIAGVTWFARTEATISRRASLLAAGAVMLAAAAGAVVGPSYWPTPEGPELLLYPYLLLVWAGVVASRVATAVRDPKPELVQRAVKTAVLGLIGLDAVLAFGLVGWPGVLIILLLGPALLLGRWVYST